ncbi:hypothetical protein HanPSC8_Chr14g0611101 [Helianthus annuus]|nr:hypothetical protein HanPSC8_Chr14g0611101 [Helianthus annuus]
MLNGFVHNGLPLTGYTQTRQVFGLRFPLGSLDLQNFLSFRLLSSCHPQPCSCNILGLDLGPGVAELIESIACFIARARYCMEATTLTNTLSYKSKTHAPKKSKK